MTIKSEILIESKSLRDTVIDRVDILEKVKQLELLPNDIHATVEMVANYYEVNHDVIRQLAVRKKDELDSDGMKTLRGSELSDIKSLCGLSRNIGKLMVFPRRAILRVGMLLQESEVAKMVRTRLLDIEDVKSTTNLVQIPTELNMIGNLLDVSNHTFKAMLQMQAQIDAAGKKADDAFTLAEASEDRNRKLEKEIADVKNGLVDINLPLRTQFNDAVKKYKGKFNLDFNVAYNNIYTHLGKQEGFNIKLRAERKGVKPIEIIEELNLLVPAIRLAKTLAGVAS